MSLVCKIGKILPMDYLYRCRHWQGLKRKNGISGKLPFTTTKNTHCISGLHPFIHKNYLAFVRISVRPYFIHNRHQHKREKKMISIIGRWKRVSENLNRFPNCWLPALATNFSGYIFGWVKPGKQMSTVSTNKIYFPCCAYLWHA